MGDESLGKIRNRIVGVNYADADRLAQWLAGGAWIDLTVGDALRATAARQPDQPALIADARIVTFREFDEATDRLAAALLQLGIAPGERAIFQLGTTIETAIALLGCFKAGVIPVCSLPQHREVEIGQLVEKSAARAYFVQADFSAFDLVGFARRMASRHPSLAHLIVVRGRADGLADLDSLIAGMPLDRARSILREPVVGSHDVLSFQLSGGTTGVPKIIPRFHAEYLGHSAAMARRWQIDEQSRIVWPLPLVHNAAQVYALMPTVLVGATTVLLARVDIPLMLGLVEAHRITHAMSIGPIAPQLLAYPDISKHDLSSLRMFATMSRSEQLEAHLKLPCSNLYGITEGMLLGSAPDAPARMRHQTQGNSGNPFDDLQLLDPESEAPTAPGQMGELCFRGPSTLSGYYGDPDATRTAFTRDGFFRTGDMMTRHVIDGTECFTFEGRLRDNINRGGEKIGCEEVESFVCRHPAVADAKLVAMPDPIFGERGCVFLIARPGQVLPTRVELSDFLVAQGLAKYKSPERLETIDAFPVTKVGKLDKPALRQLVIERIQREDSSGMPNPRGETGA